MFLKHFVCKVAVFLPKRDLIFESVFNVISINPRSVTSLSYVLRDPSKRIFSTRLFSFLKKILNKWRGFSLFCQLTILLNTYASETISIWRRKNDDEWMIEWIKGEVAHFRVEKGNFCWSLASTYHKRLLVAIKTV